MAYLCKLCFPCMKSLGKSKVSHCFSLIEKNLLIKRPDTSPVIRRKTLLKDSIERGEPFARILPGVQQRFEAGLAKLQPELVQSLETVFDMILSDFDLMFVVEELPDPRRDVLRGQVREFVDYARSKIDGEIATEFAHATSGPSYQDSTMD